MFLMSSLLLGALAASIPVIIHLLHRQRTMPLRWGAMQFLIETKLQMKRRRRVDQWLLMALRMLALLALAFLLARPLWIHGSYNPLASRLPVDVAVVVDRSLSTSRTSGQQTLFQQGAGVVDQVAGLLKSSDSLSVILAEHHPRALTPLPVGASEFARVREQLHQLKPGLSDCSIPEAIQTAREVAGRGRNVRKIILVASDAQRTSWQPENETAWRLALGSAHKAPEHDLDVHELQMVPDSGASDVSVGQVNVQPGLVGVGLPAQISATVANSGPKDVGPSNLKLIVNGQAVDPPRQIPPLPAGQSTTIRFDYKFKTAGSNWVKVQSDAVDYLPADNEAVAAINVWQKIPILVIDGQLTAGSSFKASQFLQSAMQPVDRADESKTLLQPRVVSVSQSQSLSLENFYVVIVNDCPRLPSELQNKLLDYARSGHGVWLILGSRTEGNFISQQLSRAGLFSANLKKPIPVTASSPESIELKDPRNPMVSLVASAQRDALSGAVTQKWWSVEPTDPDASVVLASTSGDPLVLERPVGRNGGRIVVWCTSVDGEWNNWPLMPNFVPLVNETIYQLSSGQTKGLDNRTLQAGEPLIWSGAPTPAIQAVDVTLPDGAIDGNRNATFSNGRFEFRFNDAFYPGLYALRFTPTEVKPQPIYYGVGIDRHELDDQTITDKDRDTLKAGGFLEESRPISSDDLAAIIRKENRGADLWKYIALALLLNLLGETYLTYRMMRAQRGGNVAAHAMAAVV